MKIMIVGGTGFLGYHALLVALKRGYPDRTLAIDDTRLVVSCEKTIIAARKAGIKKCVVLNSYFAYFDRIWPEKELSKHHPYIRCRIEQAERAIAAGGGKMAVILLELPYIV